FVPEVEGVLIDIEGILITELYDKEQNTVLSFDDGIMRRSDFDSLIGAICRIYYPSTDGSVLVPVDVAVSRHEVNNSRALIRQLMQAPPLALGNYSLVKPMPDSVTDADVLGVRVDDSQVLINLSGSLYRACRSLSPAMERAMIYSIVNTLCDLSGVKSVRFYFDGERVDTLAGTINLRGPLLENVGMVRKQGM
ncbi:MAG: GerMN domain-containing protein, partial [Clostridia bacterium]